MSPVQLAGMNTRGKAKSNVESYRKFHSQFFSEISLSILLKTCDDENERMLSNSGWWSCTYKRKKQN